MRISGNKFVTSTPEQHRLMSEALAVSRVDEEDYLAEKEAIDALPGFEGKPLVLEVTDIVPAIRGLKRLVYRVPEQIDEKALDCLLEVAGLAIMSYVGTNAELRRTRAQL